MLAGGLAHDYNNLLSIIIGNLELAKMYMVDTDKAILGPDHAENLTEGIYVRLTFRDEGRGIHADELPKIFDLYYTTKEMGNEKGRGLSLPICYSIIKKHGGQILVESKFGVGTTVTIYIPAAMIHNGYESAPVLTEIK